MWDERQSDCLCGVLRDPMTVELLDADRRRTDPVEASLARLGVNQGRHLDAGFVAVSLQPDRRSVTVFSGRRSREERMHALELHEI